MLKSIRTRAWCWVGLWLNPFAALAAPGELAQEYWLDRGSLPRAQSLRLPEYCSGAYRVPRFPHPRNQVDETFPTIGEAGQMEYWLEGDVVLSDDVRITQGNRTVTTDRARLNSVTRAGFLEGRVRLVDPMVAVSSDGAEVNLQSGSVKLDDVEFLLFDNAMRGTAANLVRTDAGELVVRNTRFSRCAPGNRNWQISASRLSVPEGSIFATARNAVVRVRNVPVFYLPYVKFPVTDERQSGLLFPSVAFSSEDGLDLTVPYYLNLAPNYDATLAPRYIADRGFGIEAEFRYLSGWQDSDIDAAWLFEDDRFDGDLDRDDYDDLLAAGQVSGAFDPADRWLVGVDHRGRIGRFSTFLDFNDVSDRDYFRDLGSDLGASSEIQLEQRGQIAYALGGFEARVWAQRFKRLDEVPTDPYQRWPEVDLRYTGSLSERVQWSLDARWVSFQRDNDNLTGIGRIVGDRVHLEPRIAVLWSRPWGFLRAGAGYRYTEYELEDVPVGSQQDPERGIGVASLNAGLFFDRDVSWFGKPIVQTLEPQLYYLFQEFEDQQAFPRFDASELSFTYGQLFRENRFAGLDRIGDAKQVALGLTTRAQDARNGREYFRASVGQIFYLEDRRVTLSAPPVADDRHSSSAIAGVLTARYGAWHTRLSMVWDPHDNQVDEAGVTLQYRQGRRRIFNIGYRNRARNDVDQTDISGYWPVWRRFGVVGRWNYDLSSDRTVEGMAGIEYNDCCLQVRLVARQFIDRAGSRLVTGIEEDKGVFLQLVFKGMAGVGDKLEAVLQRSVYGYRPETFE